MLRISLLPQEIKQQRQATEKLRRFIGILSGLFILILLIYAGTVYMNVQASRELSDLQRERTQLESQIATLQKYEALEQQVIYVNETFTKVMADVPDWKHVLTELGQHIPESVWLTDITATKNTVENTTGGTLLLRGSTMNYLQVSDWAQRLETMETIDTVSITQASQRMVDNMDVIQFEITTTVVPAEFGDSFFGRDN